MSVLLPWRAQASYVEAIPRYPVACAPGYNVLEDDFKLV
jgi:hypothetical protein